ncbi:hypothetical protein F4811DRAFT_236294 [Daldinia bambusicola]|nr:hypothetical protein F4811DRAFT_236294 [Daldinia bambusicola]
MWPGLAHCNQKSQLTIFNGQTARFVRTCLVALLRATALATTYGTTLRAVTAYVSRQTAAVAGFGVLGTIRAITTCNYLVKSCSIGIKKTPGSLLKWPSPPQL